MQHIPGRSYIKFFSSFVLVAAVVLFSILLGWIYYSTSRGIAEQQRISTELNNRNSARVLDGKVQQVQDTLDQVAARYVWYASRRSEHIPQQILSGIVNRDEGWFRLDMLRFYSMDARHQAIVDSPFFDFHGLDTILREIHTHQLGDARILQLDQGADTLWLLASSKKLIDPLNGKVLGMLFGGVVLNNNAPLCREILEYSSGEYTALVAHGAVVASSGPLPERISKEIEKSPLGSGIVSVKQSPITTWQVALLPYEKVVGVPLDVVLIYRDSLQSHLRQTLVYSGGFVVLLAIGLFLLFARFFSQQTRKAIDNLLAYTVTAVVSDTHLPYSNGKFREFNQVGMAVGKMVRSLEDAAEQLTVEKEKAEEASHAKSVFLASMSHELRTPLNAILGYAQLMEGDLTLSNKQRANVRIMYQSGDHLLRLINDILDLSKIEAGKIHLVEKAFALLPFFETIVDIIRLRSEEKGLQFSFSISDVPPLFIEADELRLRQVVLNLLTNAVKFTEHGFCALQVEVEILSDNKSRLTIQVSDSGPGISPFMQEKVFEPFQQSGERLKYSEGAGLGLAISQRLVAEMGGEIRLQSPVQNDPPGQEGVGSSFSFSLDVKSSFSEESYIEQHSTVTGYRSATHSEQTIIKVLVVDDKVSNRMVLREVLESVGFETDEAADGSEVPQVCSRFLPDIILMDLQMPEVDGVEATRKLQADPAFASVPVIAITAAKASTHTSKELLESGFCDCIYKPFQIDDLLQLVAKHVGLELLRREQPLVAKQQEPLLFPPHSVLLEIRSLIKRGDISGLESVSKEIQHLDCSKYTIFAKTLATHVENIEFAKIERLVNSGLD